MLLSECENTESRRVADLLKSIDVGVKKGKGRGGGWRRCWIKEEFHLFV